MQQEKNIISSKLIYTDHALKRMEERSITEEEIEHVLRTGYRSWEDEDRGARRFTERKNKTNPLIVVLNTNQEPNVVVTVFKDSPAPKHERKKCAREQAYLKEKKANKAKDLRRESKQ